MRKLFLIVIIFAVSSLAFADDKQEEKTQPRDPKGTVALVRAGLLMDWPTFNMLISGGDLSPDEYDTVLASRGPRDPGFAVEYSFGWRF